MSENSQKTKKLTLISLILMIFTSVFGFGNMPRSFYLMGYASIPWFILSGLTFFIPYAFMMAEYGAAFKDERGGIYSWMEKSVGPKYAFVGTFMWYTSYIIWMVSVCSSQWVTISNAIFGKDTTSTWAFLGLNSTQVLGVLGIIWIILVTCTVSKGMEKITKVTSVGGTAVALLNIVLLVSAIIIFIANGHPLEPITSAKVFVESPNPAYQTPVSVLAFIVFAIFGYGGIEVIGGLVDQTENAEVTFPKGITIAAIVISVGYSIGLFLCGVVTNWDAALSSDKVHMGNITYALMNNLGYQLGQAFGIGESASIVLGQWVSRFVGLSMFLALTGAFFTLSYSPLKQLIEGTPKKLWPGKMGEIKNGMPLNAMRVQCIIVILFIALVSFGGDAAAKFFAKLTLMTNVAMTIPYIFLAGAFVSFKKNTEIKKPFEIYKTKKSTIIATVIVTFTVTFANFFTIIEPATKGNISDTIVSIMGPVLFSIIAILMYNSYEKKYVIKGEQAKTKNL